MTNVFAHPVLLTMGVAGVARADGMVDEILAVPTGDDFTVTIKTVVWAGIALIVVLRTFREVAGALGGIRQTLRRWLDRPARGQPREGPKQ